jgi:hypothetical protein
MNAPTPQEIIAMARECHLLDGLSVVDSQVERFFALAYAAGAAAQPAQPVQRQPLTLNEMTAIEEGVYMQTTHKGKPLFEYAQALMRAVEATHNIGAKP